MNKTKTILRLVMLLLHSHIISTTQGLPCHTASGDNCTSSICPNTVVTYTCTIPSGTAAGLTDWTLPTGTCPSNSFPNKIRISQFFSQLCAPQGSSTCGPYSASSGPASDANYCLSSILTVNITAAMNGITVMCNNTTQLNPSTTTAVSMATINVVVPPGPPKITILAPSMTSPTDQLTVTWTPPTTGGVPASYRVTINDSSSPVVITGNGSSVYTHNFTGLVSDTLYTVSVVAINCAGSSNVASQKGLTVAPPPEGNSTRVMFTLNTSKVLTELRITWTHVVGSVTRYTVRVVGDDGTSIGQGIANCSVLECSFIMHPQILVTAVNYTVFLASINGHAGPESNSTISVVNSISAVHSNVSTTSIQCSFRNNQSLYCVVCCSTDPSVSPDSSVYNISTTRGTEVAVDFNGLTSGQTYYCKAAPTNQSSQNCTYSGFGGVNTIITFKTMSLSQNMTKSDVRGTTPVAIILAVVLPTAAIIIAALVAVIVIVFIVRVRRKEKGERCRTQTYYEDIVVQKTRPSECVNLPVQTELNENTLYSTPYDKRLKTKSDQVNNTGVAAGHTYSVLEAPHMTPNVGLLITKNETMNRILGTEQHSPGYPNQHTREPTTEDRYTVPAKGCTPRDGDYALPHSPGYPNQHTREPTTEDRYTVPAKGCTPRDGDYALPVNHIAITALPVKHRATDDDYALPVDRRGVCKQTGVSVVNTSTLI